MKLIKVGNTVLNLVNVVEVDLEKEFQNGKTSVVIYNLNGRSEFKGEQADALRHYFTDQVLDVDQLFKDHLEVQEIKRYRAEWRQKFDQFCQAKGLHQQNQNIPYYYERYLLDSEDYPMPGCNEPSEESYEAWQTFLKGQIDETLKFHNIQAGPEREAFKVYCLATGAYKPTWNDYKIWQQNGKPSVPMKPDEVESLF